MHKIKYNYRIYPKIFLLLICFSFTYVISFSCAYAYKNRNLNNKLDSNNTPIRITSNKMVVLDKENKVIFSGDVIATQGDMTIKTDYLTVIYQINKRSSVKDKQPKRQIKEILATGHVKIIRKNVLAFSKKAIFITDKNLIILKGKASIIKNKNKIVGDTIIIYLKQNKSIVTGKKGHRVQAIIYPNKIQ